MFTIFLDQTKNIGRRMATKMIEDAANSPNAVHHFARQHFVGRVVACEMHLAVNAIKMSMSSKKKRL